MVVDEVGDEVGDVVVDEVGVVVVDDVVDKVGVVVVDDVGEVVDDVGETGGRVGFGVFLDRAPPHALPSSLLSALEGALVGSAPAVRDTAGGPATSTPWAGAVIAIPPTIAAVATPVTTTVRRLGSSVVGW